MTDKMARTKILSAPPKPRLVKGSAIARRSAARLVAVQSVYQMLHLGLTADDVVDDYLHHRLGLEEDGELYVAADTAMLRDIVQGVAAQQDHLSGMLTEALKPAHEWARTDVLIQANLLCGAYELLTQVATPSGIIVNDYLEVTKAFYDPPIPGLVHAVLDRISKVLRPAV